MIEVTTEIRIHAPIERCFDYAKDIDIHTQTVWKHTRERAIAGVTTGRIGTGDTVTFQATHFGIRQKLTSRIVQYEYPYIFVDQMEKGAFKSMRHEHHFSECGKQITCMRDTLRFEAPLGVLGWVAERFVLKSYMQAFLESRNRKLKVLLEQQREHPVREE
ncbi:SRPBCC family protein [Paenibacillus sp. QZ-Y1]|uniref:SRPBCC family protein n=1 Tax=Paenibacillus sp. QZ-Y1 TaxID=3414511 RepID=UPI003F797AA7